VLSVASGSESLWLGERDKVKPHGQRRQVEVPSQLHQIKKVKGERLEVGGKRKKK
jgi:hypothetical protein